MDKYYSPKEFALVHSVTETTVRQWIRRGKLRSAIKVGKIWKIPYEAQKPSRGFTPCCYYIEELSDEVVERFPFTACAESIFIRQVGSKASFEVKITYLAEVNKEDVSIILSNEDRETFELALMADPGVVAVNEDGHIVLKYDPDSFPTCIKGPRNRYWDRSK